MKISGFDEEELHNFQVFAHTRGLSVSDDGQVRPLAVRYETRGLPDLGRPMAGAITSFALAGVIYAGKKGVDVAAEVVKAYLLSKLNDKEEKKVILHGPNGQELRVVQKDKTGVRIIVKP